MRMRESTSGFTSQWCYPGVRETLTLELMAFLLVASVNAMGFRVTALFFILIHLYLLQFGKQNMT